jgi:diguanylate cyclase (GGDEF)-like protein
MTVTASIGVAQARPDEGVEQLLERADLGLYEAKRSGRDRVRGHSRLMVVGSDAQGGTPA